MEDAHALTTDFSYILIIYTFFSTLFTTTICHRHILFPRLLQLAFGPSAWRSRQSWPPFHSQRQHNFVTFTFSTLPTSRSFITSRDQTHCLRATLPGAAPQRARVECYLERATTSSTTNYGSGQSYWQVWRSRNPLQTSTPTTTGPPHTITSLSDASISPIHTRYFIY